MRIHGLEGMSEEQIRFHLQQGARFKIYYITISVIVMTFKRTTGIYFIPKDKHRRGVAFLCSLATLIVGWWGFPWGPIYTVQSLYYNLKGGHDVTGRVLQSLGTVTETQQGNA